MKVKNMKRQSTALSILSLYDYIFVARTGDAPPRSFIHCTLLTLGVVITFSIVFWTQLSKPFPVKSDGHMEISLEQAINRVYFGQNARSYAPTNFIREAKFHTILPGDSFSALMRTSSEKITGWKLADLPGLLDKSKEDYRQHLQPFVNNENTLSYMDEFFIRLFPGMTVGQLGTALNLMRLLCMAVFTFTLLRLNFSVMIAAVSFTAGMTIIDVLNHNVAYSLYPNIIPVMLLIISVAALSLRRISIAPRFSLVISLSILLGILGAIMWNLRSSYFPIVVSIFALFVIYITYEQLKADNMNKVRKWLLLSATGLSLLLGSSLVQIPFISSLSGPNAENHNHVFWHPLVLSLAIPENEFAKQQGIAWDDGVGFTLAKQIDPEATYLGPTYEHALMLYYFRLWQLHPQEMESLYLNKLKAAGLDTIAAGRGGNLFGTQGHYHFRITMSRYLLSIFKILPDGRLLLLFALSLCLVSLGTIRHTANRPKSFLITALSFVGFLVLMENAIVCTGFALTLHSLLLFWFIFTALIIYQFPIDAISARMHRVLGTMQGDAPYSEKAP